MLATTAVSLLLSVALAVIVDVLRQKVWTQSQVETFWGVPVLVEIPQILTDGDITAARRKKFTYTAYSMVAAVLWCACLYEMYHKQLFLLNLLDPVLQKVVYR